MIVNLSKSGAQKEIDEFFKKDSFSADQVKKIKRLAMKYNIKISLYKRKFCKKCLSKLEGKARITKTHKTIMCAKCSYKNRFKMV